MPLREESLAKILPNPTWGPPNGRALELRRLDELFRQFFG